jgi:signal transduction histidine kinase
LNSDTLYNYAKQAKQLAVSLKNERAISLADNYLGFSFLKKGEYDSILSICDANLGRIDSKKNPDIRAHFLNLRALTLLRKKKFKESLAEFYNVLDFSEKHKDTLYQVIARNGIGLVYKHMGQPKEAIGWYYTALRASTNPYYCEYYNAPFSNMATAYSKLGRYDSAEVYIQKAIVAARKYQILDFLSGSLCELANIYIHTNRSSLAEEPLKESLSIRKELNDPVGIILDKSQLALYYANNGDPGKGISLCNEAIEMAENKNLRFLLPQLYESIAVSYKKAGDFEKYSEILSLLIDVKDSSYRANSADALAETKERYRAEKRENIINQQELFITQQKLAISKKNYWLYGSALLVLFASMAAYMAFMNYRRKKNMELILMVEREKRMAEMAIHEAEENERKRIAADLHDSLGAYAASIASNIEHLPAIDQTSQVALQELKANSQSIVSQLNDTIWVLKRDSLLLTAISDRLKQFIQRIQSSYPSFSIDVSEEIATDHMLSPSQAFHLFQILQEAVTNALKHSGGDKITIHLKGNGSWSVAVADNGRGFNPVSPGEQGNGINNMKQRSGNERWGIVWSENEPSGTIVTINPTTN